MSAAPPLAVRLTVAVILGIDTSTRTGWLCRYQGKLIWSGVNQDDAFLLYGLEQTAMAPFFNYLALAGDHKATDFPETHLSLSSEGPDATAEADSAAPSPRRGSKLTPNFLRFRCAPLSPFRTWYCLSLTVSLTGCAAYFLAVLRAAARSKTPTKTPKQEYLLQLQSFLLTVISTWLVIGHSSEFRVKTVAGYARARYKGFQTGPQRQRMFPKDPCCVFSPRIHLREATVLPLSIFCPGPVRS